MTPLLGFSGAAPRREAFRFLALCVLAFCLAQLSGAGAQSGAPTDAPPVAGTVVTVDVLVYGSEPEGIAAAVTAAEEGATTLLITPDERLGGLFVLGELNMLDLRTQPFVYHQGIFDRWWRLVGHDEAFDVRRAERAFDQLLRGADVPVWRAVGAVAPILEGSRVAGVALPELGVEVRAAQVIDASGDADLAAAAGAPFDFGFERFGVEQRMADTLVLNVAGVDWAELRRGVQARGRSYAIAKATVAWGHFGGVPAAYEPRRDGVRLRGLNLGLQEDGTVLINALLLYGLDPLDPGSLAAGRALGLAEGEDVVAYLRQHLPGFGSARLAGAAESLYVRESRHLLADCVLTGDDVMDSRVTPFDVAAGGYPLDAQTYTPHDSGFVWGTPDIYGGRLCMMVSSDVDGLWVVGRSAGYDPIAFSSARVVPFGMTMAEAAGVAAAQAAARGVGTLAFVGDETAVLGVRSRLAARGAHLPELRPRNPVGPTRHPHYAAFRTLLSRGLAVGGYENEPHLDQPVSAIGFAYLLSNVATRFYFDETPGAALVQAALQHGPPEAPLTADVASEVLAAAACALLDCPDAAGWPGLVDAGLATAGFAQRLMAFEAGRPLTRGQAYELAAALAERAPDQRQDPRQDPRQDR